MELKRAQLKRAEPERLESKTGTGMTLREIDEALAAWNLRLTAMANNLMSLQAESAYRILTGSSGMPKLEIRGETAARANGPLVAMGAVFEQFDLLHSLVDRATALRQALPTLFGLEEKLAEIERLLCGKSIELPVANLTLEERTLLTGAPCAQRLAPEELLAQMSKRFAEARDAVLAVDHAWQQIAEQLVADEARIGQLEARFAATGCGLSSAVAGGLAQVRTLLQDLSEMQRTDPLGAARRVHAQLEPALGRLASFVASAEQAHREILRARNGLQELTHGHGEALEAQAEAKAKVAESGGLPAIVPSERLRQLEDWLAQLERRWAEGAIETVAVGLRNWHSAAKQCGQQDARAREAACVAVAARRELRGRMEAMKAKARALGLAEDAAIAALALEADSLLAARPTQMPKALAAVAAYCQSVNQARKES